MPVCLCLCGLVCVCVCVHVCACVCVWVVRMRGHHAASNSEALHACANSSFRKDHHVWVTVHDHRQCVCGGGWGARVSNKLDCGHTCS